MFRRQINLFEKILLPVGIAVTIFGFYMLVKADLSNSTFAWLKLIALLNWLMLLFLMILAATNEDVKEELAELSREHVMEVKYLKEIANDQLEEMKLLREELTRKKK